MRNQKSFSQAKTPVKPTPPWAGAPRESRMLRRSQAWLPLLLAACLGSFPVALQAAPPALLQNQVLWVMDTTNSSIVGAVGLQSTSGVDSNSLRFRFVYQLPRPAFKIEVSSNYVGLVQVEKQDFLDTNLFSLQVAATNNSGGSTNWVQVLSPIPFKIAEMSPAGSVVGRVVTGVLTNTLRFAVDTNTTADLRALAALTVQPDGEIRVANSNALDFEAQTNYVLSLTANNTAVTAAGYNQLVGRITIVLTNVNEAPLFTEQSFTFPTNAAETLIGPLNAQDPDNDPLAFDIIRLSNGEDAIPNDFFVMQGAELHLRNPGIPAPPTNILTVVVREIRTNGQPALTNVAEITVEAPKTYSRYGIPLLLPIAGHDVSPNIGLPVQAIANGTNQEVFVTGIDDKRQPYLKIFLAGLYGPESVVSLDPNFVPTVIAASGTNIYVGGSRLNRAVMYRFSTKGMGLLTNNVANCFNITDMIEQGGRLYFCGGGDVASGTMKPYWAEMQGTNLTLLGTSPNIVAYGKTDIPGAQNYSVEWGVATAIAREANSQKVFLAGYWKYTWWWLYYANGWNRFWGITSLGISPARCTFLTTSQSLTGGIKAVQLGWNNSDIGGSVIKKLKLVESGGNTSLLAVHEIPANGVRSVQVKEYTTGLLDVGDHVLTISSATGDVRAESLTMAGEEGGESLYLAGVLPGGVQTTFKSGNLPGITSYPGSDRFFLVRLESDLKLSWPSPLLLERYNYVPTGGLPQQTLGYNPAPNEPPQGPRTPLAIVVPYNAKGGVLLAGNIASGELRISQSGNQNSVNALKNHNAGFVTIVKTNKSFEVPSFLEIVSDFGRSEDHVQPFSGLQMFEENKTVTVRVLSPLYVDAQTNYIGDFDHPPTEQQIKTQAVTRYVCTGYTVADGGVTGDSPSYTFEFKKSTKITFHWTVEHALDISSDLTGTGAANTGAGYQRDPANRLGLTSLAAGNPTPEVKKHWIAKDELVIPTIDGSAMDPEEYGTRYVVTGYVAMSSAVISPGGPKPLTQLVPFPAVEPRQQIQQFPMRGPASIVYLWGIQHRIQVNTTTLGSFNWPGIKVLDDETQKDRTGIGDFWFRRHTHLIVGAQNTNNMLEGASLATGDLADRNLDPQILAEDTNNLFEVAVDGVTNSYVGAHIQALSKGTVVTWQYGDPSYAQQVVIGNAVDLAAVGQANLLHINTNKPPEIQVIQSPAGSTAPDMCEWDEVSRLSYPLRPGVFRLNYEERDRTNIALRLKITSRLPPRSDAIFHLVHREMPPVNLDPDPNDNLKFLKLAFTTNATVNGNEFSATNLDTSVLLFSRSESNAIPYSAATGRRTHERLLVRVVATTPWEITSVSTAPVHTWIGAKLSSTMDTAGIGTGFVIYTNAPYNAAIYDRSKTDTAGPIIPVNRQFRDWSTSPSHHLVVIWYQRSDAILWPYTSERFDPQWPVPLNPAQLPAIMPDVETMSSQGTNYLRRIVIASRLGSESKDHALRNQLSFTLPRYDQVKIYTQPSTNMPGFNPNEEHALIAPSFKFLDQAAVPPAAYALRNDFNNTNHDATYTSDPYVLVQYLDNGTNNGPGEYKVAVYAVELEDDRPQLNPDIYTSAISGQERQFPYLFHYTMKAGEPVQPPYPLGLVIGLTPCSQTYGTNLSDQRVYWEDYNGQPWAISAGEFRSHFHYPLPDAFAVPNPASAPPGTCIQFNTAGKVFRTGAVPNPQFSFGQKQFTLNGHIVTFSGIDAISLIDQINSNTNLVSKVRAVQLDTGEIRLVTLATDRLDLEDGINAPLARAGLLPVLPNPSGGGTTAATTVTVLPTPAVRYTAAWPDDVPILKAGETLTFAGGEYKADNPTANGLPGVVGWAAGEVIFDTLNPTMNNRKAFTNYTARLISPLEERSVQIPDPTTLVQKIQPAQGMTRAKGTRWQFTDLPASLSKRVSYDPLNQRLGLKGFLNDKTLGDPTLTASPPPVYVLEPNILTPSESNSLSSLLDLPIWQTAVSNLYALSRNPSRLNNPATAGSDASDYFVGLDQEVERDADGTPARDAAGKIILKGASTAAPLRALGPGLALVPSPAALDPASGYTNGYITLVENNDPDIGGPITLHIVKVSSDYRFRGAIKTILSDNVFDEKITLRHSGDFGANAGDIVYQWFYRQEDGTEAPLPPGDPWHLFPDQSDNTIRGRGIYQINLEGAGGLLLADNLFFVRYRHMKDTPQAGTNSTDWSQTQWDLYGRYETNSGQVTKIGTHWAGAANSPTVDCQYKPQLVMGWIKRVLDRINPFEARISDFRTETAPATYASMIQEFGQRYEGPVALNPDKNVIENVGLIELYETVLDRGMDLSINLSSPIVTPGINTALQLAATRISDFYVVLGNEAYSDAQDPTIAYGDDSMDFATDYGNVASSMFSFQNQAGSLLDEELALLRGVSESYGRPVYNRLFWNFTKSLGEVAYAVNYNITDFNRDGFVDESDAMALYPQGHGDAWGHYLTALKCQYRLLQHPYYNWISRSEQYNLLDVVLNVDYLDERRFAEAAAARAKAGAEIVDLTYRSRYVDDPDGQWQGYTDIDSDRAWGVDGWARRAGQGALFDWITANALLPSQDTNLQHNALQKIDRTTVTALQTLSAELGEIQSQYDNANNGLNPLGVSPDVVPFDIDATFNAVGSTAQIGRPAVQGLGHFSQIYERAVEAVNNARIVFDGANFMQGRQRQVKESADSFRQEVIEQDMDFRNRLIEIFGTPYEGQIGAGKAYPAGYYGPDLMLWMYVNVNDINNETVPPANSAFSTAFSGIQTGIESATSNGETFFVQTIKSYFNNDWLTNSSTVTNVDLFDLTTNKVLVISNLPLVAANYSFRAPPEWGRRASPGELQIGIAELVQAQADLELAIAEYNSVLKKIDNTVELLKAKHNVSSEVVYLQEDQESRVLALNGIIAFAKGMATALSIGSKFADDVFEASHTTLPKDTPTAGMSFSPGDIFGPVRAAIKSTEAATGKVLDSFASVFTWEADFGELGKEYMLKWTDNDISREPVKYEILETLKELEQELRNERMLRLEAFKRLQALSQASDSYRRALEGGMRLLDQRQVFNIRAAGVTQRLRYQDMAFRVFRNDALQKYRAAYDLAARYTYLAAKAFDYETNLSPDDRGSAQPLLTDIVRSRTIGIMQDGEPVNRDGLAGTLAALRDNWGVLCGRMSFNNAQYESELISLRSELFRIHTASTNDALWRQTLTRCRVDDLWQVPEFRRYCRPPAPRSAGPLPGLVIPFGTQIVLGKNVFGWPLGPGDHAYDPSVFATKIQSAAVYLGSYPSAALAATPRVYLVPAGLDLMTIPTSATLQTREWNVVDQAIPVPRHTGTNDLADPAWIPAFDGLPESFGQIRRFSSFLAKDLSDFDPSADSLSYDTRLIGRSVWNTRWLLIIPGGHLLADGEEGLDTLIYGARVPGGGAERDGNGIKDLKLLFHTYGYSGN